jgi:hypothetical protein
MGQAASSHWKKWGEFFCHAIMDPQFAGAFLGKRNFRSAEADRSRPPRAVSA